MAEVSTVSTPAPCRSTTQSRRPEDTIELVRRLPAHYPDSMIAGILNHQGRNSAYGHRFTANLVGNLRRN